jgi:heat shock protein HtpX
MLTRGAYYIGMMLAILLVFGIFATVTFAVLDIDMTKDGDLVAVLVISCLWGFGGSLISLFMSKFMVKKAMKVRVIEVPSSQDEIWLVDTVRALADKKGVGMPEVGIYNSREMNAFATGWNRNNALVCVSTGLFSSMSRDECEAVLGHEMSHVANGDMVTSSLLQGLLNSFVYAFSTIFALLIANTLTKGRDSRSNFMVYRLVYSFISSIFQVVFGVGATLILMKFSRWREFRADAGSAEAVGADKMIAALEALRHGSASSTESDSEASSSIRALCISDTKKAFLSLFASHPPLNERIDALRNLRH